MHTDEMNNEGQCLDTKWHVEACYVFCKEHISHMTCNFQSPLVASSSDMDCFIIDSSVPKTT